MTALDTRTPVRLDADGMSPDEAALRFDAQDPAVAKVRDFIRARAKSASHAIEQDETDRADGQYYRPQPHVAAVYVDR